MVENSQNALKMLQNDATVRFDVITSMPEIQASDWVIPNVKSDGSEKYFSVYNGG